MPDLVLVLLALWLALPLGSLLVIVVVSVVDLLRPPRRPSLRRIEGGRATTVRVIRAPYDQDRGGAE